MLRFVRRRGSSIGDTGASMGGSSAPRPFVPRRTSIPLTIPLAAVCATLLALSTAATGPSPARGIPRTTAPARASEIVTLEPVADATIGNLAPDANYGGQSTLEARFWSERQIRHALLRFNLAAALPPEAVIDEAWLALFQEGWSGADQVDLRLSLIAEDWIESQVAWDTRPATGEPERLVPSAAAQAPVRFEVTEIARAWHNAPHYGLQIAGIDDGTVYGRTFASRENAERPPRLEVHYHLPSPPVLQGRVYEGRVGEEELPLAGVTLALHCSDEPGRAGALLAESVTDDAGWYGLEVHEPCPYYNLVEADPPGYHSVGASTVDGRVIGDNWIQYAHPLEGKVLSGNKFWDALAPPPSPTATASPTGTPPPSPTALATATAPPTVPYSPTPPASPSPSVSPTASPPGSPTATSTATAPPSPTALPSATLSPAPSATAPPSTTPTTPPPPPAWDFSGQVLDAEDQPAAGLELRLLGGAERTSPGQRLDWTTTDDDGRFALRYEPPGGAAAAFPVLQVALLGPGLALLARTSESGGLADPGLAWLTFLEAPGGSYGGNRFRVRLRYPTVPPPLRLCAVADAWVGQDDPTANHGSAGTLRTGYYTRGGAFAYRGLLDFELAGLPADLDLVRAELELRQLTSGGADPVELRVSPIDQRWSESGVTWANQPGHRGEPFATAALTTGTGIRRWEVSEIVEGWRSGDFPALGLVLHGPEGGAEWWRDFESRENPSPPTLALHPRHEPGAGSAGISPSGGAPSVTPGTPRLVLMPPRGTAGSTFWVLGYDLPPSTSLALHWDHFASGAAIAQVQTDALGAFGLALQVPVGAIAGQHPLLLFDVDAIEQTERLIAQASFLVEPHCWRTPPPLDSTPAITLSPTQGPSNGGNTVQVSGSGWRPNATVKLYWDDPALCATFISFCLGQATANAAGGFLTSFSVPTVAAGEDHQVIARTDPAAPPLQQALAAYRMVEPPSVPTGDTQAPAVFARHEVLSLYDGGPPIALDLIAEAFDPETVAGGYHGIVRVELWAIADGGSRPLVHKKCTVSGWTPRLACLHVESGPFDAAIQSFWYWALAEDRSGNVISSPVKRAWLIDHGPDADDDGLSDAVEAAMCSDPKNPDTDRDNLLDGWEVEGYGFPGGGYVDLPSMGAHPCQKDLFVELDWTAGREPVPAIDLQPVINAYMDHGVRLHVDHGQWGGGGLVSDTKSTALQSNFDPERHWAFHYVVFRPGGGVCWRGKIAYIGGGPSAQRAQTFMHELGHCIGLGHGGMSGPNSLQRSGTPAQRAQWGFRWLYYEQDTDSTNNKPNYLSAMSYAWNGLVWLADTGLGDPGFVFRYDYSEDALPDLDEKALDERAASDFVKALRSYPLPPRTPAGGRVITMYGCQDPDDKELYIMATDGHALVGRFRRGDTWPTGWQFDNLPAQDALGIDWDCDGKIEPKVQTNINGFSGEGHIHTPSDKWTLDETLRGRDDWARLPSADPCLGDTALGSGFLKAAHDPPCESKGWVPAAGAGTARATAPAPAFPPGEEPWTIAPPSEYCNGADDDGDGAVDEGCLDSDGDGIVDDRDNCPESANAQQRDGDADGVGDACAAAPPAPSELEADLVDGAVVLRWRPVAGARGYTIHRLDLTNEAEDRSWRYLGEEWPATDAPTWRDDPAPEGPALYQLRTVSRVGRESRTPADLHWPGAVVPGTRIWLPAAIRTRVGQQSAMGADYQPTAGKRSH